MLRMNEQNQNTSGVPLIRAEHVSRDYSAGETTVHALRDVSFDIREGEFIAILGPSGSGKSTMLNILGGIETATAGRILFRDGEIGRILSREAWQEETGAGLIAALAWGISAAGGGVRIKAAEAQQLEAQIAAQKVRIEQISENLYRCDVCAEQDGVVAELPGRTPPAGSQRGIPWRRTRIRRDCPTE